jgi:hypothetical protein
MHHDPFIPPETVPIGALFVRGGEPVLGTHIFPLRLLGWPFELTSAVEVTRSYVTPVDDLEVLVTRMGGLFVRIPESLTRFDPSEVGGGDMKESFEARAAFADRAVAAFNLVVCEFTFAGVFSEPTSRLHLGPGALSDGRASIHGGSGPTTERTLGPQTMMGLNPMWASSWESIADERLVQTEGLSRATALWTIADSLPTFVASAYFFLAQRLLAEALLDGWIVVEQILNRIWEDEYVPTSRDSRHRDRLDDTRSFTANVKAELLFASGLIDGETYDSVQSARKRRNDLAHGGRVDVAGAFECMAAMKAMLEKVVSDVPRPTFSEFVNF